MNIQPAPQPKTLELICSHQQPTKAELEEVWGVLANLALGQIAKSALKAVIEGWSNKPRKPCR